MARAKAAKTPDQLAQEWVEFLREVENDPTVPAGGYLDDLHTVLRQACEGKLPAAIAVNFARALFSMANRKVARPRRDDGNITYPLARTQMAHLLHVNPRFVPEYGFENLDDWLALIIIHDVPHCTDELKGLLRTSPGRSLVGVATLTDYYTRIELARVEGARAVPGLPRPSIEPGAPPSFNLQPRPPPPPAPRPPSEEEEEEEGEAPRPRITFTHGAFAPSFGRRPEVEAALLWTNLSATQRALVLTGVAGISVRTEAQRYAALPYERLPRFLRDILAEKVSDTRNLLAAAEEEEVEAPAPAPPPPSPAKVPEVQPAPPPTTPPPPPRAPTPPVLPPAPVVPPVPPTPPPVVEAPPLGIGQTTLFGGPALAPGSQAPMSPLAVELEDRYRPGFLSDVLGNSPSIDVLRAAAQTSFPKALLLVGPPGSGKTSAAMAAIREYLRSVPGGDAFFRLPVPADRPFGIDPKVVRFFDARDFGGPGGPEKLEAQIRQFARFSFIPGAKRFVVLDDIGKLPPNVQEQFKVVFEHPPGGVTVFLTSNTHNLNEALTSRIRVLNFRPLTEGDVAGRLRTIIAAEGMVFPDTEEEVRSILDRETTMGKRGDLRQAIILLASDWSVRKSRGST